MLGAEKLLRTCCTPSVGWFKYSRIFPFVLNSSAKASSCRRSCAADTLAVARVQSQLLSEVQRFSLQVRPKSDIYMRCSAKLAPRATTTADNLCFRTFFARGPQARVGCSPKLPPALSGHPGIWAQQLLMFQNNSRVYVVTLRDFGSISVFSTGFYWSLGLSASTADILESFYGSPPNFSLTKSLLLKPASGSTFSNTMSLETKPRRRRSIDLCTQEHRLCGYLFLLMLSMLVWSSHETFVQENRWFWGGPEIVESVTVFMQCCISHVSASYYASLTLNAHTSSIPLSTISQLYGSVVVLPPRLAGGSASVARRQVL